MTVRTRFAPSPTGYLHIGGARTALYSYLFAKANKGTYVLRIEDTDQERSKKEFEEAQISDLKWLGIEHDEGPGVGGDFGPYHQSERKEIYLKYAEDFIKDGKAYYCFLTQAELDELTAKAESEKKAPHAYHGKYRDLPLEQAKAKIENGEEYVIRFKNPQKTYSFKDQVRGEVTFQEDMVGDFVIIRSNGLPVYNFCCVIDDHLMKISHVIRAEEHLNNTVRQLMIYEAIGAEPPIFAHVSLLIGEDRQKLSKRHGATSVNQYREQAYLPEAMINYLSLLGWSHPEEKDIFDLKELISKFDLTRFSKSPAMYDIKKMNYFNEQHLKSLDLAQVVAKCDQILPSSSKFHRQDGEWKLQFCELFLDKVQLVTEYESHCQDLFSEEVIQDDQLKEALSWETTGKIINFVKEQIGSLSEISSEQLDEWMNTFKKEWKIKGKPLFMGTRVALTGRAHGSDLKKLVSLMDIGTVRKRMEKL